MLSGKRTRVQGPGGFAPARARWPLMLEVDKKQVCIACFWIRKICYFVQHYFLFLSLYMCTALQESEVL